MSIIKEYYAKSSTRFTNADAKVIGPQLAEIANKGPITARDVVETAKSSNSPLHDYFEWDDAKAAEMHRLGVAREMVRTVKVRVISNNMRGGDVARKVVVRTAAIDAPTNFTYETAARQRNYYEQIRVPLVERATNDSYQPDSLDEALDIIRHLRLRLKARREIDAPKRRFEDHPESNPEAVRGLPPTNRALVEGRTLFPTTVVAPAKSNQLLVSGEHSRKLGDRVTKGPWASFPIFQLTLEERATCPHDCFHWATCYGNGMQFARRHKNDADLIPYLRAELTDLQDEFPNGFVVRLHVLGDFYSVDYVEAWAQFLDDFPALHVFGYTAWARNTTIGAAIKKLTDTCWDHFAIRFSDKQSKPQGATTIWREPEKAKIAEGIVCPAQTDKTDCCGSCGLCWAPAAKDKTIVFIAHGPKKGEATALPAESIKAPSASEMMGRR